MAGEGLRERKKRLMRQQLSDTATAMFLERGFEAVRVAEIAEACGVSEKTVFNYFPTKESLLLDRWDATVARLRAALADPEVAPVEAVVSVLDQELHDLTGMLEQAEDPDRARSQYRAFGNLLRSTPALQVRQRVQMDQVGAVIAGALAERAGLGPGDPEPQIVASALLGLWQVHLRSLGRSVADGSQAPEQIRKAVAADVARAAAILRTGIS